MITLFSDTKITDAIFSYMIEPDLSGHPDYRPTHLKATKTKQIES